MLTTVILWLRLRNRKRHELRKKRFSGALLTYLFLITPSSQQLGLRQGYSFPGTPWTHLWGLDCSRPGRRRPWKEHPCLPI